MSFPALGVNRKVVDIDEIYLNMRNEQNLMTRFLSKWQKPRFWVIFDTKVPKYAKFEFSRKIRPCHFFYFLDP